MDFLALKLENLSFQTAGHPPKQLRKSIFKIETETHITIWKFLREELQ
jgi:hypothetical protein